MALAEELGHPFGRAAAFDLAAILHQLRGEPEAARARAEDALSVSETYGIAYYRAWAVILLGWTDAVQGAPAAMLTSSQLKSSVHVYS